MNKQDKILKDYATFVKKNGRHPSRAELTRLGISRDSMRWNFGNMKGLKQAAKEKYPEIFKNVIDADFFTEERTRTLETAVKKCKRFVITTAVTGCAVNLGFYNSIKNYCRKNKATLLVLTASDPASIATQGGFIDPILVNEHLVMQDIQLNRNIAIRGIKLSAKAVEPTTGLGRIGQKNGSFIYASPKQRLKMTATSNVKLPHAMMTTGAITNPNYQTDNYLAERTAYIADNDHVMGALIVEIVDQQVYHFRQIQCDSKGAFADLGKLYSGNKVTNYRPDSLVLGDWHSGETDPDARAAFVEAKDSVVAKVKPRRLVVHDGFNGMAISHHEEKNRLLRARRAEANELNLEAEIRGYAEDLQMMAEKVEEVVIVKSNHDEFLDRYLDAGRYVEDAQNHRISLMLAYSMLTGKNPLAAAMDILGYKFRNKLRWLNRDQDFKVAGIELGAHGDKGSNGTRGSLASLERAYGSSISGHSHTAEILRRAWQVGTCSKLKLEYNKGPSSWIHSSCLVYPNGQRQLINVIYGKWRMED